MPQVYASTALARTAFEAARARERAPWKLLRTANANANATPTPTANATANPNARRGRACKIRDEDLRDQAQRATRSVFLQLCEGLPNDRIAMRRNDFTRARNGLFELVGCPPAAGLCQVCLRVRARGCSYAIAAFGGSSTATRRRARSLDVANVVGALDDEHARAAHAVALRVRAMLVAL